MKEESDLSKIEMTETERVVYIQIVKHLKQYGMPPTLREISNQLELSHEGVRLTLKKLDKKGHISLGSGSRNIAVIGYSFKKDGFST